MFLYCLLRASTKMETVSILVLPIILYAQMAFGSVKGAERPHFEKRYSIKSVFFQLLPILL